MSSMRHFRGIVSGILFALFALLIGEQTAYAQLDDGDKAPPFALRSLTNKSFFLEDLVESNEDAEPGAGKKIILLVFSSSQCEKCEFLFPLLEEAHQKWVNKGLKIFFVGVDEGKREMIPLARKHRVKFSVCNDKFSTASKMYGIEKKDTPTVFLISPYGEIEELWRIDFDRFKPESFKEDLFDEIEDLVDDYPNLVEAGSGSARRALVYGRVPADMAVAEGQAWQPFMFHLEQTLGVDIVYRTTPDYASFIEALKRGEFDLANIGPLQYMEIRGKYEPIARVSRNDKEYYAGVIIGDSKYNTLVDLKGQKIAFVDEDSTSGYLFPFLLLAKAGLIAGRDYEPVFLGSHSKVARAVLDGKIAAGACFDDCRLIFTGPEDEAFKRTRKIAVTEKIPGDPVIVKRSLDPVLKDELQEAVLSASMDDQLVNAIKQFDKSFSGFLMAMHADYDPIIYTVERVNQIKRQIAEEKMAQEKEEKEKEAPAQDDPKGEKTK